jgi:NitT/TauT family transport system permease protein
MNDSSQLTDAVPVDALAPTPLSRLHEMEGARAAARRRRFWAVQVTRALALAGLLGGWQVLTTSGRLDELFFSKPSAIWSFLQEQFTSGDIWSDAYITLRDMAAAFALGTVLGIGAAVLKTIWPFASDVLDPFLTVLNALPRVALAPMFIIWFGIGEASKIYLSVTLVFFIVLLSAEAGLRGVDEEHMRSLRAMSAGKAAVFLKVQLPSSVPSIFGGLRLAVVYSLLGVVFGEMMAAQAGLGHALQYSASTFQTQGVMAYLAVLALIALALNSVVVLVERYFLRWQVKTR